MTASYHQIRDVTHEAPPGCPVHDSFTPLDPAYATDPYPMANALREDTPVVYAPELGYVAVNSMELVDQVFRDHDTYSSANVQDPVFPICEEAAAVLAAPDFDPIAVMSNRQEPDHGRIRKFTTKGFSNRRNRVLEPWIRARAAELIEQMLAGGSPADFIPTVGHPLPGEVVFQFMGFPEADFRQLKAWCGERLAFSWGQPTPEQQVEIAEKMLAYWRYVREFIAGKRENPGDDFTSELLADHEAHPDLLSYREVESILYGLSFAGHEPVTLMLGNALLSILPRRDVWGEMVADPERIGHVLEEVIRWNSPQIGWRRITNHDTVLGGVELPKGTQVFLNLGAANRDPDTFDDPDEFDPERPNARFNMSFGKGIHYCLGAKFARAEARIVFEELVRLVPSLRLHDEQHASYFPNLAFRGPSSVMVAWD